MSLFVLVPGAWLGGWAWSEVVAELTRRGHQAVPVTLTGLGERRHLASRAVGLSTHIQDVVSILDTSETPDTVLVGHSYGIFPALGAADRRPRSVGRIVFLDTGMPRNGQSVVDAFLSPEQKSALQGQVQTRGDGWRFPLPEADALPHWGNLAGLDAMALDRLRRLAAPHPYATFTEPLVLTGGTEDLPTTKIFCTAGGIDLALLRALHSAGDPRVAGLLDDRSTYFELPTGHYPMLSMPGELVNVLVEAAAGGGLRLGSPSAPD
ncbi:alpha/beta fold hydrolase [Streptomyces sp. NPDC020996]|uniref:alpha/beta fold hydrolase n=1 Tax=Streptomyces sp. NPDC020996 TaxID=3154791 RepID=UPI0033F65E45